MTAGLALPAVGEGPNPGRGCLPLRARRSEMSELELFHRFSITKIEIIYEDHTDELLVATFLWW